MIRWDSLTEDITHQISEIDTKITQINGRVSSLNNEKIALKLKLEDLMIKREKSQRLLDAGEKSQKILKAEKRLTEIEKLVIEEQHRIYNAQQIVVEAAQKLEALSHEAWNLASEFPQVRHLSFDVPMAVKKFAYAGAVPASWAKPP